MGIDGDLTVEMEGEYRTSIMYFRHVQETKRERTESLSMLEVDRSSPPDLALVASPDTDHRLPPQLDCIFPMLLVSTTTSTPTPSIHPVQRKPSARHGISQTHHRTYRNRFNNDSNSSSSDHDQPNPKPPDEQAQPPRPQLPTRKSKNPFPLHTQSTSRNPTSRLHSPRNSPVRQNGSTRHADPRTPQIVT